MLLDRNYDGIERAGLMACQGVYDRDPRLLRLAIEETYKWVQLKEGMKELPLFGADCVKYCGSGHGGYALYVNPQIIDDMIPIRLII